jgi:chromosome segregation ATPase
MNSTQVNYDKKIRHQNTVDLIDKLTKKLNSLENAKNRMLKISQLDKKRNNRESTLLEYKQSIAECDKNITGQKQKIEKLKKKITPPVIKDKRDKNKADAFDIPIEECSIYQEIDRDISKYELDHFPSLDLIDIEDKINYLNNELNKLRDDEPSTFGTLNSTVEL